jgi:excisionase family DNA binding protein
MSTIKITRDELRELYYSKTVKEVAVGLGVSRQTVYELLKKHGIPPKEPKGNKVEIVD